MSAPIALTRAELYAHLNKRLWGPHPGCNLLWRTSSDPVHIGFRPTAPGGIMTDHPYEGLPNVAFWNRSVSGRPSEDVDPVTDVPFQVGRDDRVVTAGSCFAQHISRALMKRGFNYLVTETAPATPGAVDENYGIFPARFGNVYTVRHLLQLFERAYGLFDPIDKYWTTPDRSYVDPFRPQIQKAGFATKEDLDVDRKSHLAAVREAFEQCDVFVFTLGLTEGWISKRDGAVFPLASGVHGGGDDAEQYAFQNFDVASMAADLLEFIERLRTVNAGVRIILTVSPVPLAATYEKRHVLAATVYSKSALRVVAEMVSRAADDVAYFPSYELITGAQTAGKYFEDDLRNVRQAGVDHVMGIFGRHFLSETSGPKIERAAPALQTMSAINRQIMSEIICDEEALSS